MARSLFAGMSDYSHQSLKDVIEDMKEMTEYTKGYQERAQKGFDEVIAEFESSTDKRMFSDFLGIGGTAIKLFDTCKTELIEIAEDLATSVQEHHVTRLAKLGTKAQELNVTLGRIWHSEDKRLTGLKYGTPRMKAYEKLYANARQGAVELMDLSNMAARLRDFLGRDLREKEKNVTNHVEIHNGSGTVTINGSITQAKSIENSLNAIQQHDDSELQLLVEQLVNEVGNLTKHLPEDQQVSVTEDLDVLLKEASKEKPAKRWWSVSIEGLTKAAENLGALGEPVLSLVGKIAALLAPKSI